MSHQPHRPCYGQIVRRRRVYVLVLAAVMALPAVARGAGNAYLTTGASPGAVRAFDISSSGLLGAMAPASVPAVNNSRGITLTPDGRTLYVTGDGPSVGAIGIYRVDAA